MKRIKSYTSIWNVEKVLYALGDIQMLFPLTFTQIAWLTFSEIAILIFRNMPPFSLIDNALINFLVIPGCITWFMSQKTFDGMKPLTFLKSVVSYLFRSKETYMGSPVKVAGRVTINEAITIVRSEVREPEEISSKIYRK